MCSQTRYYLVKVALMSMCYTTAYTESRNVGGNQQVCPLQAAVRKLQEGTNGKGKGTRSAGKLRMSSRELQEAYAHRLMLALHLKNLSIQPVGLNGKNLAA